MATVYTVLAQVVSLDGPSREVGTRETSILTSTTKTFAPTLLDNGEVSGKLLYDPKSDSHVTLDALIASQLVTGEPWKLTFADASATTYGFLGVFTKFAPTGIEIEANLEADFAIKISGPITIT